ncbi:MAG: PorP/SprF family type IX secretion system membrane protein [Flavobacteriales bacterium]
MMNRIAVIICCLCQLHVLAQDTHFSQFYVAQSWLNPAASGHLIPTEITFTQRSQWASFTTPFKTTAATVSVRLTDAEKSKKGFWATGLQFMSDESGDGSLHINTVGLNTVYHVRLDKYQHLGLGLQGVLASRTIDFSNFQWASQYNGNNYDPTLPVGESSPNLGRRYLDFNTGLCYTLNNTSNYIKVTSNNYRQFTAGLSLHHINRPNVSFFGSDDRLYTKMVMHSNGLFSLFNSPLAIQPSLLFMKQGPHEEFTVGGLLRYEFNGDSKYTALKREISVSAGAHYRLRDAIVLAALLQYGQYNVGIGYDINVSKLTGSTLGRGAFEFNVRMAFNQLNKLATTVSRD